MPLCEIPSRLAQDSELRWNLGQNATKPQLACPRTATPERSTRFFQRTDIVSERFTFRGCETVMCFGGHRLGGPVEASRTCRLPYRSPLECPKFGHLGKPGYLSWCSVIFLMHVSH